VRPCSENTVIERQTTGAAHRLGKGAPRDGPEISGVGDAELGSLEFWGQPAQERDRYFETLRREAPISRHEPPEDMGGGDFVQLIAKRLPSTARGGRSPG
jgi:hypothetical protein